MKKSNFIKEDYKSFLLNLYLEFKNLINKLYLFYTSDKDLFEESICSDNEINK